MRIVGGTLRGRALTSPTHDGLRPTSDRVRESLFNILSHGSLNNSIHKKAPAIENDMATETNDQAGFTLKDARILDLFAGTGALGIEALSRGARYCLFVEQNAAARALIQHHIAEFGLGGNTRIFRRDATAMGRATSRDAFDLVFLDPPYGQGLGEKALAGAVESGWLKSGAIIVFEENASQKIELPPTCIELDYRRYGSTQIIIAQHRPS